MMIVPDILMQIAPSHAARDAIVTTNQNHTHEVVRQIQGRAVCSRTTSLVPGGNCLKGSLVASGIVVRLSYYCSL